LLIRYDIIRPIKHRLDRLNTI